MATMDRGGVAEAFMLAHALVARPEVAARWDEKSAYDGLTVGGLSVHLLRQATHTARALIAPPPLDPPIGLLEHYDRARPAADGVRENDNRLAEQGPVKVLAKSAGVLARLPELLDRDRDPDWVHVSRHGWNLHTQDFLITRSMGVVVHADDLTTSVDLEPMVFPYTVTTRVVDLLSMIAVHRHGVTAVVRTFARPERAPESVSPFSSDR